MLQEQGPRQKTRLMTDIITFEVGNSTILNQDGKMKILSHVACFYSKCLAKMKNERPAWQCFLTIPVAGWREETGWHFRLQKRVFQGCFAVVVILVFVCSFVLKLFFMHTTTWHQYPALPRTNEMTTGSIMVPDGNKRNSLLVCCWFSLYSGLPLSSQISI